MSTTMSITPELVVVMPAYNEAENLLTTVRDFMDTLEGDGFDYRIIVVNDGSQDSTGTVADALSSTYPGRVTSVHHVTNQGYGSAVRTGITAALDSGSTWVLLTDSDGQFKADQVKEFVDTAKSRRSSLVLGYREHRADSLKRRLSAKGWTYLNRVINGVNVRDVDCAYKLIHRRTLQQLELRGEAAVISPELIAKAKTTGINVIEIPTNHYPRLFGEQTGSNIRVILRSLLGMLSLFHELFAGRHRFGFLHPLFYARDRAVRRITVGATVVSILAASAYLVLGYTLAYPDSIAHQLIARRVLESPTPGFGQLGGVWLPLTHVLMLPFVWNEALFYSGVAGTLISMLGYVLTCRYLFMIGRDFKDNWVHGAVAAAVFAFNPNVLYMQSTPMTEIPLIAGMAGSLFYLQRWCRSGHWRYLTMSSIAIMLACLIRYEAWVFLIGELAVIAYVGLRQRAKWSEAGRGLSSLVFFAFLGTSAISGWLIWNTLIFRDPLFFQSGLYAKPSLWVDKSEKAIGNWDYSFQTYLYAVNDNLGTIILVIAGVGLLYYIANTRLRPEAAAPLSLLILAPFFVYALQAGQRPMHVAELGSDLYNLRFGLVQILPAAVFIAYLSTMFGRMKQPLRAALSIVFIATCGLSGLLGGSIVTLKEAVVFQGSQTENENIKAANWLRSNYDGGKILLESFGNETVTFKSHLPTSRIIYEGTNARGEEWAKTLRNPSHAGVRWIYFRTTPGNQDMAYKKLYGSPLMNSYELVYRDNHRQIYRSREPLGSATVQAEVSGSR